MIKALLISIQPQHALNILNGKKTLELRTWIPKDYVGWVYIYETYGKQKYVTEELWGDKYPEWYGYDIYKNGKRLITEGRGQVVALFWFDEYDEYNDYSGCTNNENGYECENEYMYHLCKLPNKMKELCLTCDEIETYGNGKILYAWHIKKLEIFDKPKDLSEFYVTTKYLTYKYIKEYEEFTNDEVSYRLKKAPQKMQWVYNKI